MDIYGSALSYLSTMPFVASWPEMQTALAGMAVKKPRDWELPVLSCLSVGGRQEIALQAVVAIACLQISIILIDDLLDEDPRGEYQRIGAPAAANLALGFQAAGLEAIARSKVRPKVKLEALQSLNRMILTKALGQSNDVQNPDDESGYWNLVRMKSSPFFGSSLYIGGLFGGATIEIAKQLEEIGHIYGEMIQIHDDLNDAMSVPANPDWIQGRSSLPILFATVVDYPHRERILELRKEIANPDALAEAQTILIRCGAVSYCIDQLLRRHQAARGILDDMTLPNKAGLEGLLDRVIQPVEKLFETSGLRLSEVLLKPADAAC